MGAPDETVDDGTAVSPTGPWSPPESPFQNARQRRFTESRLTLSSGQLTWAPVAARSGPGSRPFTVTIGPGVGQAAELVWLSGNVVPSRNPGLQINTVAVCSQQSYADRGKPRQVLGYLPIGLFAPYTGAMFDLHDLKAPTEQKIRAVAQAAGLGYSAYSVRMGEKINTTFPGTISMAGLITFLAWIQGLSYLLFGSVVVSWQAHFHNPAARIGLIVAGGFMAVVGVAALPPVTRLIKRWRRAGRDRGQ